jgi:hypothetical protein
MLFDLSNLPYWIVMGLGVLLFTFVIASGGSDRLIGCVGTVSSGIVPYAKARWIGQVNAVDSATRIYAFPGANVSSSGSEVNKLLLSTSGLALINTLLEHGKLGVLLSQLKQLLSDGETSDGKMTVGSPSELSAIAEIEAETPKLDL